MDPCLTFLPCLLFSLGPNILPSLVLALALELSSSAYGVGDIVRSPRDPSGCAFLTWLPGLSDQGTKSFNFPLPQPLLPRITFRGLTVRKYHALGGFKEEKVILSVWGQKSETQVWAGLSETLGRNFPYLCSVTGTGIMPVCLCHHTVFSLCNRELHLPLLVRHQ